MAGVVRAVVLVLVLVLVLVVGEDAVAIAIEPRRELFFRLADR